MDYSLLLVIEQIREETETEKKDLRMTEKPEFLMFENASLNDSVIDE